MESLNNCLNLCTKYDKVKEGKAFLDCNNNSKNQNQIKLSKPSKTIEIVCYEIEK